LLLSPYFPKLATGIGALTRSRRPPATAIDPCRDERRRHYPRDAGWD